jgi:hypothetical protein
MLSRPQKVTSLRPCNKRRQSVPGTGHCSIFLFRFLPKWRSIVRATAFLNSPTPLQNLGDSRRAKLYTGANPQLTLEVSMLRKTLIAACLLLSALMFSSATPLVAQPAATAAQKPFVHPLFSDNMVLQRDIAAPVWGWTRPGQRVTVTMSGKRSTAVADATGKWMVKIGPFAAGGPHTLTASGPQSVTLNNVMTGDVWICSGQSNMEQGIGISTNAEQEIANANYPNLRL